MTKTGKMFGEVVGFMNDVSFWIDILTWCDHCDDCSIHPCLNESVFARLVGNICFCRTLSAIFTKKRSMTDF